MVYLPTHRSHVDYLLLSYVLFSRDITVPHIAAGDNLQIPLLGWVMRKGGAFFMRRSIRGSQDENVYKVSDSSWSPLPRLGNNISYQISQRVRSTSDPHQSHPPTCPPNLIRKVSR